MDLQRRMLGLKFAHYFKHLWTVPLEVLLSYRNSNAWSGVLKLPLNNQHQEVLTWLGGKDIDGSSRLSNTSPCIKKKEYWSEGGDVKIFSMSVRSDGILNLLPPMNEVSKIRLQGDIFSWLWWSSHVYQSFLSSTSRDLQAVPRDGLAKQLSSRKDVKVIYATWNQCHYAVDSTCWKITVPSLPTRRKYLDAFKTWPLHECCLL